MALTLPDGMVPERLYVGLVKVVDSRGVRLGLVDRNGVDLGYDLFVSWEHLQVLTKVQYAFETISPLFEWKC